MQTHLPIERPNSFFTCASGGLGHSLPAAVGMALATAPQQRVIGLFGDGSAMYSIQALWSAADLKLPMTIVIVNNGGYAALKRVLVALQHEATGGDEAARHRFRRAGGVDGMPGRARRTRRRTRGRLEDRARLPVPYLVDVIVT